MSIRECRFPDDFPNVLDLWQRCAPGISLGASDTPQEIEKKLCRDPDLFLVLEEGGKILGTVLGGFDGRRGMVYHLAVDPAHRQEGLGHSLMQEVEARLRRKGCRKAYLLVVPGNGALDFYLTQGWQPMPVHLLAKELL
ncbi:MAG: GNAT family N-acetyltransferase [Anaerolineales bacterium]